ncbi:centrosomal protein of 68 kDa [Perognathus longimembris pacificus]|uniref:centrosomal protein of 68 kDa n=1 Tax=Perognathus longimembris pacificus TaxID=214514 RepID=UPI002019EB17|nr:centrosomal protein of 68 kDa [Perognathus longimembris pacificus]XP_048208581.1 centrosomal protein of 68 kDa [Perognathus longimembris pacificus]
MALGEEDTEVEASVDTKAQSCGRLSCRERELPPQGPQPERPPPLEAEGRPASSEWGAEASSVSGTYLPQANTASRKLMVDRCKPAPGGLLPPGSLGPGDFLPSVESQVEETKLSVSQKLPQNVNVSQTTVLCSGHDADTEEDPSPVDLPWVPAPSQQPPLSGFPSLSRWKSMVSPSTPHFSSRSVSASSTGSSLQGQQDKVDPHSGSFAKVSSLELAVPQGSPSVVVPGSQFQWSQPVASGNNAVGQGRRRLSFQAEYWACVLPESLPPSPDRHSPLWNPNKEYEDLLDYTYPLRPGPQLPKRLDSHVLQDSGVDLDSFSVSPASTLKSPTNVSPNYVAAEAPALPFSGLRESSFRQWPSRVSQKQDSVGLASWNQLASTPRAPGNKDASWESRAALQGTKNCLPMDKHLEVGSPQLRTRDRGQPPPKPEREKRASQTVQHPACTESGWKAEEEVESDDEYLALPARLTQVSSLVSYLSVFPTLVTLPTGSAKRQSSLEVSDSSGPASPSGSSQSQLPSGATFQGTGGPEGQNPCFLRSVVRPQDSTGRGSLMSNQALGISSGPLKTHASLRAMSDRWPFSGADVGGQLPRTSGELEKASLVQCVQVFCCQLEELIHWLYNVPDVADLETPPRSSLTDLKSSLQLYRQFKKDVDEHQSLTENVLQKGEILLQCLLDNTPVLKDVLGRISKQSDELESHADHLYDSILASLDMLAGCTLIPDNKPMAAKERPCEGV